MPTVKFLPLNSAFDVEPNTKILVAATRNKVQIRFGCASCRCGTCGVKVDVNGTVTAMKDDEKALLTKMGLQTDGTIRLACQTRVLTGDVSVDLDFQNTYSPDDMDFEDDDA